MAMEEKDSDYSESSFCSQDGQALQNAPPPVREAEEVFIYMKRNYRVSRNVRAHWFFDHLNKNVSIQASDDDLIEETTKGNGYESEMRVAGIIARGGRPDEVVYGEQFKVCHDTRITYISRYYRHVYLLDLSPSTVVADEETNCCLHTKLLECLRLSMFSAVKSFTIPGTNETFIPQIYIAVSVFSPFLSFEKDLVLEHGILLTESNIEEVLGTVTTKFNKLLLELYEFSKPILKKWGKLRRRHRTKFDSTCESETMSDDIRTSMSHYIGESRRSKENIPLATINETTQPKDNSSYSIPRGYWKVMEDPRLSKENEMIDPKCDGYIHPEWALIFMLRQGLMSVQMLPENTQSNIIVITDAVCGMPDASALQLLLTQLRSFTVSCSFIQLQGRSRSEACFGHVASGELFHFLAMATFGVYIPNCKCSTGIDMDSEIMEMEEPIQDDELSTEEIEAEKPFIKMNPFHRALLCWCFQNALQDNVHITNLVNEINPDFAELYKKATMRRRYLHFSYTSTLHELLNVRLREGFTLKKVDISSSKKDNITVLLSLPFRPLVFIEYTIHAKWPEQRDVRDQVTVDLVVHAPRNELNDFMSEVHLFSNTARNKLRNALRATVTSIVEADTVLLHLHSFNTHPDFYTIPVGVSTKYPMFKSSDQRFETDIRLNNPHGIHYMDRAVSFVDFWQRMRFLDENTWQKWVHTHTERVVLRSNKLPWNVFALRGGVVVNCDEAEEKLHSLLKEIASFCLDHRKSYVKFIMSDDPTQTAPRVFYIIRVSMEAPCHVLRIAFLGSISSSERKEIVDGIRRRLIDLKMIMEHKEVDALSLVLRPLEKLLVRYRSIPEDLKTIVRVKEKDGHGRGESDRHLTLHNATSKYLECRRRIWCLPFSAPPIGAEPTVRETITKMMSIDEEDELSDADTGIGMGNYVLAVLLQRRMKEGFRVAWSEKGIVGLCRQLITQRGRALEQYVLFPPTHANLPMMLDKKRLPSFPSHKDDEIYKNDPFQLVLIAEVWREPCAFLDSETIQGPTPESDDELVSVLFTLDQLLKMCGALEQRGEIITLKVAERNLNSPEVMQPLSGCVEVFGQPFDLPRLLLKSERALIVMPTFEPESSNEYELTRVELLLSSIHYELEQFYEVCMLVEDDKFWETLTTDIPRPEDHKLPETGRLTKMPCRIYLRMHSPWVVTVVVVPTCSAAITEFGGLPVLYCLCDEPRIAYGLGSRRITGSLYTEDRRKGPMQKKASEVSPAPDIPFGYITNARCADMAVGEYKPGNMDLLMERTDRIIMERARVAALYTVISKGISLQSNVIADVLEDCDSLFFEIDSISQALQMFCVHMQPDKQHDVENRSSSPIKLCCDDSKLEYLLAEELYKQFKPIPNLDNYYYYLRQEKEKDKDKSSKNKVPWPFKEQIFESEGRRDTYTRQSSAGENTPDDASSMVSSFPNTAVQKPTKDNMAKVIMKKKLVAEALQQVTQPRKTEVPLYIFFLCAVHYPDNTMDTFPVTFLPSCIHQILKESVNKPNQPYDIAAIKVKLNLYVLTWHSLTQIREEEEEKDDLVQMAIDKKTRFLEKLPDTERQVVSHLIKRMQRMIEMEMILAMSRRDSFSVLDMQKICQFIVKEAGPKSDGTRIVQYMKHLPLIISSDLALENFRNRLDNMCLEYTTLRRVENSNYFYCCKIEDKEAFNARKWEKKPSPAPIHSRSESRLPIDDSAIAKLITAPSSGSAPKRFLSEDNSATDMAGEPAQISLTARRGKSFDIRHHLETVDASAEDEVDPLAIRREQNCDFWMILTVGEEVTLQFVQRYDDMHKRPRELLWRKTKQMMRSINQEILLTRLLETRVCHSLLMSSGRPDGLRREDGDTTESEEEEVDEADYSHLPRIVDRARTAFSPGEFACPIQDYHWFPVHYRLTAANKNGMHRNPHRHGAALDLLNDVLQHMKVKNIPRTYVLKEQGGNIVYLQLHVEADSIRMALKESKSRLHKKHTIANFSEKVETNILLTVHGIHPLAKPSWEGLRRMMERKLDQYVIDHLTKTLSKNPNVRMEPCDVQFIQRDPAKPTAIFNFSIPKMLSGYMTAVSCYIHQHMDALLPSPKTHDPNATKEKDEKKLNRGSREAQQSRDGKQNSGGSTSSGVAAPVSGSAASSATTTAAPVGSANTSNMANAPSRRDSDRDSEGKVRQRELTSSQKQRQRSMAGEDPSFWDFRAYPHGLSSNLRPMFYFFAKGPQEGSRYNGIAAIEVRIIHANGEWVDPFGEGVPRLNATAHATLARIVPDRQARSFMYRELTYTKEYKLPLGPVDGVCAYCQVFVWEVGDIGMQKMESTFKTAVQLSLCDVVTEFGILNIHVMESSNQAPASPSPFSSPPCKLTPTNKSANSASERRQVLKKRDSSETLPHPYPQNLLVSTPSLPESTTKSRPLVFSFDATRRGSVASEIDRLGSATTVDFVLPSTPIANRIPDHVSPKFVATAADWFDHVVEMERLGDVWMTVVREYKEFDCKHSMQDVLLEACDKMEEAISFGVGYERVVLCQWTAKTTREGRYEVVQPNSRNYMTADLGCPIDVGGERADLLLIGTSPIISEETLRFGFDHLGDTPEILAQLTASGNKSQHSLLMHMNSFDGEKLESPSEKHKFMPCLSPFVPRQRLIYGLVHGGKLTMYYYNFQPNIVAKLSVILGRAAAWHNAKARLIREIGLHKMGITHLSPLKISEHYQVLVWRNPDELLEKNFPPNELNLPVLQSHYRYAPHLFRLYRRANHPFLLSTNDSCLLLRQTKQMRFLRECTIERLNNNMRFNTILENLQNGFSEIKELDLRRLIRASRLAHFVQTPVLFFPKWRKKIAEVRSVDGGALRKSSAAATVTPVQKEPISSQYRPRANTLSVPQASGASGQSPGPLRFHSEDDDPCQVKILFMLMNDYIEYLTQLGLKMFEVTDLDAASESKNMFRTDFSQNCHNPPHVSMYATTKGGIIIVTLSFTAPYFHVNINMWSNNSLTEEEGNDSDSTGSHRALRELERRKDDILTQSHVHSFTYDFHLRMMSTYLVGKDQVLFNPGYNTHAFLIDFLEYYGCRPPNARNCVYEERLAFPIKCGVRSDAIWDHFIDKYMKDKWNVVKLKITDGSENCVEHMKVNSEQVESADGKKGEVLRVVLRDRRNKTATKQLNVVLYLIQLSTEFIVPLSEERFREGSQKNEGEFKNVIDNRFEYQDDQSAVEELINLVSAGILPSIEGSTNRRRFSSGGHLQTTPAVIMKVSNEAELIGTTPRNNAESLLRSAESDNDMMFREREEGKTAIMGPATRRHRRPARVLEDGDMPGEQAMYVHFYSARQRKLQEELEESVSTSLAQLTAALHESESECWRDFMWSTVLALPTKARNTTTSTLSIFLSSNPARNQDAWFPLRAVSHDATSADLDTMLELVKKVPMASREARLDSLLLGTNCARMFRFLYARYGANRCRFFEYPAPHANKKCLLLTNPDHLESAFLIRAEGEKTPTITILFKTDDVIMSKLDDSDPRDEARKFIQMSMDAAFDDLLACVTAFLWSDLLQMPPGASGP